MILMQGFVQVGIDIPSIKATLSDSEYRFITSVAGSNFGEPLRLPAAAQWLEDALIDEPMEDAESHPSLQVRLVHQAMLHLFMAICLVCFLAGKKYNVEGPKLTAQSCFHGAC